MTVTHRGATERTYFDAAASFLPTAYRLLPTPSEGSRQKAEGRRENTTRALLTAAVGRQMISDVPMGCFLSGGIDSSIIALLMRKHASDVRTFSIAFEDPRYDESGYAQRVATHLGTRHETFTVRPDAAADLPKLAAAFGEPFGDSSALPTYYLSRRNSPTRESGTER